MEFEPLDEDLEGVLQVIVDRVDEYGWSDGIDYMTLEYRELKRLGLFQEAHEYYDLTASVRPTYAAMKYFERKGRWEAERRKEKAAKLPVLSRTRLSTLL